ncbi:MAG: DUF3179 domain-containing protein [Candidatus Nanohaloarchaea archaeon]|nr:DUF3179 domain-containing protein [Candidatus Nanohaloarchaea archaeon]
MDISDSLYISLVSALFVVSLAGMAVLGAPGEVDAVNATRAFIGSVADETAGQDGDRLRTLCLGSGCIPPIDDPSYRPARAVEWLEPGDLVVAVSVNGQDRAYPLSILRFHGVVNTRIGGTPVAVTYSPYSGVPRVFRRNVSGGVRSFQHSGQLYNGNMVMQDRETGTRWVQFTGTAIDGRLAGTRLERVDAHIARWGIWREDNPAGRVLSRRTGIYSRDRYLDRPYFTYRRSRDAPFSPADTDIHPKDVVYGATVNGSAVAYREAHVEALDIVHDTVGGEPMLVVQDERRDRILAFSREVGGTTMAFALQDGRLVDTATGSTWTLDGTAVDGPLTGTELRPVPLTRSYWYTWQRFHPHTGLYHPPA